MMLVVGLGNPGKTYAETRHNAGFRVVELLAERWSCPTQPDQAGNLLHSGQIRGERVLLARPQKFMNRSGQPVAMLMGFYKLSVDRLVVIHDELDLPAETVRVKQGGGHGGHNGLRDLIQHLGPDFLRVRVGIGRPPEGWQAADYVLARMDESGRASLGRGVELAADAVEAILAEGSVAAMNRFNPTPTKGGGPRLGSTQSTSNRTGAVLA